MNILQYQKLFKECKTAQEIQMLDELCIKTKQRVKKTTRKHRN